MPVTRSVSEGLRGGARALFFPHSGFGLPVRGTFRPGFRAFWPRFPMLVARSVRA